MTTLSIVIPAYNEERFIGTLLQRIRAVDLEPLGIRKEIVVVDDCSADRTSEIVAGFSEVRLHRQPVNGGKGKAVRQGISMATGELLIIQDADLEQTHLTTCRCCARFWKAGATLSTAAGISDADATRSSR